MNGPIIFTPCVERGYRAIRFEGRWEFDAAFGAKVVTRVASPTVPAPLPRAKRLASCGARNPFVVAGSVRRRVA